MIVKDSGGGQFEPAPAGTHVARCIRLLDLGTQKSEFGAKRQVLVTWELPQELISSGELEGQPFTVSAYYTMSLNEKANLRHALEAWRGRAFTVEELKGFDLKAILGAPCLLSIVHNDNGRAKVSAVMALAKGTKAPKQINESVYLSLDPHEFDRATFDGLNDYWKEKIQLSPEWAALKQAKAAGATVGGDDPGPDGGWDDDQIPF